MYSKAWESEWRYQVAKRAKELQRDLEGHLIRARYAAQQECFATMERELDEAIVLALAHPEVLAARAEGEPVRNAAVEGAAWDDDPA